MKISRVVIFTIFLFLLANCTSSAQQTRKQESKSVEVAQNKSVQLEGQEDFYGFLDDFSTNRIFQLKRIVFPIIVSSASADSIALAPVEEKIEKMDWELLDLTYDSTYTTRDYDRYTQTINFRKDTAHVSLRGIDNGIFADYYFKLIDGEWFLVTLVE